jgi:hypothetical protein
MPINSSMVVESRVFRNQYGLTNMLGNTCQLNPSIINGQLLALLTSLFRALLHERRFFGVFGIETENGEKGKCENFEQKKHTDDAQEQFKGIFSKPTEPPDAGNAPFGTLAKIP